MKVVEFTEDAWLNVKGGGYKGNPISVVFWRKKGASKLPGDGRHEIKSTIYHVGGEEEATRKISSVKGYILFIRGLKKQITNISMLTEET